jgi:hypothetical protein
MLEERKDFDVEQAAKVIVAKVRRDGPMTPGILKHCLRSDKRVYGDMAIDRALERGWLKFADGRYAAGATQP